MSVISWLGTLVDGDMDNAGNWAGGVKPIEPNTASLTAAVSMSNPITSGTLDVPLELIVAIGEVLYLSGGTFDAIVCTSTDGTVSAAGINCNGNVAIGQAGGYFSTSMNGAEIQGNLTIHGDFTGDNLIVHGDFTGDWILLGSSSSCYVWGNYSTTDSTSVAYNTAFHGNVTGGNILTGCDLLGPFVICAMIDSQGGQVSANTTALTEIFGSGMVNGAVAANYVSWNSIQGYTLTINGTLTESSSGTTVYGRTAYTNHATDAAADQLAADQTAVAAKADKIQSGQTILGVAGQCAVPDPGSVVFGVPVGSTTGTAILEAVSVEVNITETEERDS